MWVEALKAGRHGTQGQHVVTPGDVADAALNVEAMMDNELTIPGLWFHSNYSVASKRPPRALTFGNVIDLHHDERRRSLALKFDVEHPAHKRRLKRMGHVSPLCQRDVVIEGERYEGLCVGHVASTNSPAQVRQRAVEMSWCPVFDPDAAIELSALEYEDRAADAPRQLVQDLIFAFRERGLRVPKGVDTIKHVLVAIESQTPRGYKAPKGVSNLEVILAAMAATKYAGIDKLKNRPRTLRDLLVTAESYHAAITAVEDELAANERASAGDDRDDDDDGFDDDFYELRGDNAT